MSDYQPKVSNVQKHEDSQSSCVVVSAKLVFVKADKDEEHKDYVSSNQKEGFGELEKPILISEEEIEKGDYGFISNEIVKIDKINGEHAEFDGRRCLAYCIKKVLALPEHFSDKHLQAIVDGKMENGDGVLVKCDKKYYDGLTCPPFAFIISLDQQNHITLFPAKQSLGKALKSEGHITDKELDDILEIPIRDMNKIVLEVAEFGAEWAKKNNY